MKAAVAVIGMSVLAFTAAAHAQQGVRLELSSNQLEVGEVVNAQLVCSNTGEPQVPEWNAPDGLDVALVSSTPSSSHMTQIINGRRNDRTEFTFALRVQALREGTFALGPFIVTANNQSFQSNSVTVRVRDTQDQAIPLGDRMIYVRVEAEPASVYVTETIRATLTIGMREVRIDGRAYNLNMLSDVLDQQRSQFSIFAGGSLRQSETVHADSSGRRHRYLIYRVTQEVRAEHVGSIMIGPIFLRANYPLALRRGFFGRPRVSRSRKETARADAIAITVKGPPEDGRPRGFSGAIGNFALDVSVKPDRIEQGQPATLTIAITGTPLDGVAGPDLSLQPELVSRFDFTKDELVGDIEGTRKIFRRAVFPKQPGEQTVPPISWSYFDPRREQYVTLMSEPVPIAVEARTHDGSALTLVDETPPEPERSELTIITGGLAPNYTDPALVLAHGSFRITPVVLTFVLAGPPLACLSLILFSRHRARLRGDIGYARRKRARWRAGQSIRLALAAPDPTAQLEGLARAMSMYLSERFNLPPGQITPGEARKLLQENGLNGSLPDEVAAFFDTCDAARYAPGAAESTPAAQAAQNVKRWIRQLEASTR